MTELPHPAETRARVVVLLATRNGARWLPAQLRSILDQEGVEARIVALDDESSDGTAAMLAGLAAGDSRVTVLPSQGASGGAAANFYRLLEQAEIDDDEFVALSDQDDLWRPGKLARHASLLRSRGCDGVSSDVISFSEYGRSKLIRKSFPQRHFDYLLESPGPGSTFLMSNRLVRLAREVLAEPDQLARGVDYHDWLLYALCRAKGWGWHIDPIVSVDYRQHAQNAMGANVGVRSSLSRLSLIRRRWHRNQAARLAAIATTIADRELLPGIRSVLALLTTRGLRARLSLVGMASQLRRRPRDRVIIGVLIGLGVW